MACNQRSILSCVRLYLSVFMCFCSNNSVSASSPLSLPHLLFFSPSLSPSPAGQTAAELLQKKKHSEIWHCIIMPQTCTYHSIHAPLLSSPLPHRNFNQVSSRIHWPCDNRCQTCAHCQQRGANKQDSHVDAHHLQTTADCSTDGRREAALGILFVTSVVCCKHPPAGSPVEMALLGVRGGRGEGRGEGGSVALEQHWFLEVHASVWRWLCISGAFTQSFVPG